MSTDTSQTLDSVPDGLTTEGADEAPVNQQSSEVVMRILISPSGRRHGVCRAATLALGNHKAKRLRPLHQMQLHDLRMSDS